MNLTAIAEQVRIIAVASHRDPEVAHSTEDKLYHAVLAHIAQGDEPKAARLAQEALLTKKIKFPRWCA